MKQSIVNGQHTALGETNNGAIIQEFIDGTVYALDGVSRDGEFKVTAIWKYDKRNANGADFVSYGMHLCDGYGLKESKMIKYALKVNKALGVVQGPSHIEMMYDTTGPVLIQAGARLHGGEGTWLPITRECIGYTQIDACLNCYLRPDQFDQLPLFPTLNKRGAEAFLVALDTVVGNEGSRIRSIPGVDKIAELPSFRRIELSTQPGTLLQPTVDCFSRPGSVCLVSSSPAELDRDYATIRDLESKGLFIF